MARLRPLLAVLLLGAALAAGCGGGFADSYQPIDRELHGVGLDLVRALQGAKNQTNMQFAATIRGLEHRILVVRGKLKRIGPPPDDVRKQYRALQADLRKVDDDMIDLAARVAVNDVVHTKSAARKLIADARAVTPQVEAIRRKLDLPAPK